MIDRCSNCDTPLEGDFCSQCGQSTVSLDVPVSTFAKEFVSEAFSVDGRIRNTLWPLLVRPGEVARAYVSGHRAGFVPPIRLYIFASFAMFLALGLAQRASLEDEAITGVVLPSDSTRIEEAYGVQIDLGGGPFEEAFNDELEAARRRVAENPEAFNRDLSNRLATAMFFLLPLLAALLKVAHRDRLYVHHLIFAVYFKAVAFLLFALTYLPEVFGIGPPIGYQLVLLLLIPLYLALAMKRFYGRGWIDTLLRFWGVAVSYLMAFTVLYVGTFLMAFLAA